MIESIESWFTDPDIVYWIIGVAAALFTLAFYLIYRLSSRYPDGHAETLEISPKPPLSPVDRALSGGDLVGAKPESQEFREPSGPHSDFPDDLFTRTQGGLKPDPTVRPHTTEEIQLPTAKPLSGALANTRSSFFGRIRSLFGTKPALGAAEMEELEEILYTSDLGPQTVQRLLDAVEAEAKSEGGGIEAVRGALKREMLSIFQTAEGGAPAKPGLHLVRDDQPLVHHGSERYLEGLEHLNLWTHRPAVLMVVGVNGAGKTTTIGKLSSRLAQSGKKVLVAAGDTFRAAAGNQLKVWTERAQVEIFSPEGVTDPSAVSYAAVERARAEGFDVVIIDTAGRLHTQKNLMEELRKMKRVIEKIMPGAPHEILLVLDANSGQNALIQAREYHEALTVTGVVLTKLDGSAKGGVAVGLAYEMKIPIKLIGVGEGIDDLRRFTPEEFVDSIL